MFSDLANKWRLAMNLLGIQYYLLNPGLLVLHDIRMLHFGHQRHLEPQGDKASGTRMLWIVEICHKYFQEIETRKVKLLIRDVTTCIEINQMYRISSTLVNRPLDRDCNSRKLWKLNYFLMSRSAASVSLTSKPDLLQHVPDHIKHMQSASRAMVQWPKKSYSIL